MIVEAVALALTALMQSEPACWRQGAELRQAGAFTEAGERLEVCVDERPEDADAWVQLGLTRLAQGDTTSAGRAFDAALALAPDYEDASIGLARIAYFEGDHGAALAH